MDAKHEKPEKKNTINGPRSPFLLKSLTNVYAVPAQMPPISPIKEGKLAESPPAPGFIIKRLPIKAIIIQSACDKERRSFSIKYDAITAKNGDNLFNIVASDKSRWSMA